MNLVGPENLKLDLIGPEKELDLLRETFEPLGTRFFHTDENSLSFFKHSGKEMKDTHVSIVPYHKVKPENMEMYQKIIEEFYENTKKGKAKCLFYEFARNGDTFFCREAYQNAEEILAHFNDVTETHQKSVGLAEVKVAIMGPKNELDKLRKIPEIKVDYFDLDDGSMITIE